MSRLDRFATSPMLRPGAGLLLLLLAATAGCDRSTSPEPERIAVRIQPARPVSRADGQRGATYLASVKGRDEMTLSFKVPGIVQQVGAGPGFNDWEEGTKVAAGRLLARLEQSDFLAESNSAAAQASLDLAQYERTRTLLRDGAASQQEYERALAAKQASQATLALRSQILRDSEIHAPFDGTILKREINSGETVAAGQPILAFARLDEVEVEVGVPDRLVGRLRTGERIPLRVTALDDAEFEGEVREVGVAAREGSRLFRVRLRVENHDGRLRPGMTASVDLDAVPSRDAANPSLAGVLVPLSALVARNDHDLAVFVVSNGVARERPVVTSDILRSSIVVTSNLVAGESVVVAGASLLYDGAVVDLLPPSPVRP